MARPVEPDSVTRAAALWELQARQHLRRRVEPHQPRIEPRPHTYNRAPLSFSQERLWFLDQLEPGTPAYNLPILLQVSGPLNRQILVRSFQEVVRRHEVLRTAFLRVETGGPAQIVLPRLEFALLTIDLTNLPAHRQETESSRLTQALASLSFDLSHPPLVRGALLALSPFNHQLLVAMHHIVSDGWSLGVLIHEVGVLYEAFLNGRPSPLPELPIQYADFAVWQREWIGEILEAQLAWWREYLAGAPPLLELPTDQPRPSIQSFRGSTYQFSFDDSLIQSVTAMTRQQGVTPFMLMLGSWAIVLSRHADQDDVLVGTPIAGRRSVEVEGLIGFFVNTLVLRTRIDRRSDFIGLLRHVREIALDAYAHQDVPFEKVVEELSPERTLAYSPLFQVMLVLQNTPAASLSATGLTFTPIAIDTRTAKFDLTLTIQETREKGFEGTLEYNTDLFDSSTAKRLAECLQVLIKGAVAEPRCRIAELPLLTKAERFQMLSAWNSEVPMPLVEPLLYRRFQSQAALHSDEVAILYGKQRLTFMEVSRQAELLAAHLAARGVGPEVVVGLRLELSPELIITALAVLAAGGVYLPLVPSLPDERQAMMLLDAGARLVIASEAWPSAPAEIEIFILSGEEDLRRQEAVSLPEVNPESLAYVLYTSGSTGRPKGVMVQHRALMRYIDWAIKAYEVEAGQGSPVHSSPMYDLTVTSLWVPLLAGRTVTLLSEELGSEALASTVRPGANFSLVKLTPAHLDMLTQQVSPELVVGWTRSLVIGGDALHAESLSFWYKYAPETRIFNEYGPTETVVGSSVHEVQGGTVAIGPVPIGRPISGARLYVLDRDYNLVPIGVYGELLIGGECVTRGYKANPSMTAERFLPDPFSTTPGNRMYKSGDLVRWTIDAVLEYRGRIDHQIKIRGFRIELGEIEVTLSNYPGVRGCAVIARKDIPHETRLVAYVVGENLTDTGSLQAFLAQRLPKYMIPTAFVHLESLPLTPNGKVDRRALPKPNPTRDREALVPPRTPSEEILAGIWADVLGLDQVGVQDNFFELGGHSLLAAQVASRVSADMGVDLPLSALFQSPTITGLAGRIASLQLEDSGHALGDLNDPIDAIYDEMIALVRRHGKRPGLREALRPLREKLQALQEIEAQEVAAVYDSHFRPDYELAQALIAQAQDLLNKK